MPVSVVKNPGDEALWEKAKEIVLAMGISKTDNSFWARVMAKFEELKKSKKK